MIDCLNSCWANDYRGAEHFCLPTNNKTLAFSSCPFYVIRIARMCNGWHIVRGQFCHPLTRSAVIRFVTADYAVRASFKFLSKSIGFPRARVRHHIGFILSCEKLTDIGQISLCWKCKSSDILNQKWEHICDACGKNNAAETCSYS